VTRRGMLRTGSSLPRAVALRSGRALAVLCVGACLFFAGGLASRNVSCGQDRCFTARQACASVGVWRNSIHVQVAQVSDSIPVEYGYLADEAWEAACGY
jgi:hypothetical protein